jgi:hypothetical protein
MTRSLTALVPFLAALPAGGCFDLALPVQVDAGTVECDGGRYDPQTGLCWQDPPTDGGFCWQDAIAHCEGLELGGHSDWRLPSMDDFFTLLDDCDVDLTTDHGECRSCDDSETCHALFCGKHGCGVSTYWSSSLSPFMTNCAWQVDFNGGWLGIADISNWFAVRCVRSDAEADTDTGADAGSVLAGGPEPGR